MTVTAKLAQVSNTFLEVVWSDTEVQPAAGYQVDAVINAGVPQLRAVLAGDIDVFADDVSELGIAVGDTFEYLVENLDGAVVGTTNLITYRDLEQPFTFGPIDALISAIRYTSLEEVKRRVGIDIGNTDKDDLLTQAAIAAEVQIDQMNGRSFPDTGSNPEWPGVPETIRSWATDAAVSVYKRADAPFGVGGSDNWIGTLDVADEVERALRRNPLAVGYKVSFGVGFAS